MILLHFEIWIGVVRLYHVHVTTCMPRPQAPPSPVYFSYANKAVEMAVIGRVVLVVVLLLATQYTTPLKAGKFVVATLWFFWSLARVRFAVPRQRLLYITIIMYNSCYNYILLCIYKTPRLITELSYEMCSIFWCMLLHPCECNNRCLVITG